MDVLEIINDANRAGSSSLELPYDEARETELRTLITDLVKGRIKNKATLSAYFLEMNDLLSRPGRGGKFATFIDELPLGAPSRATIYRWIEEEKNRLTRDDSSDPDIFEDVEDDELNEEATEGDEDDDDEFVEPDDAKLPRAKNFILRLRPDTYKIFADNVAALVKRRGKDATRATLLLELVTAAYEAEIAAVLA
jgi:hypothetical protein